MASVLTTVMAPDEVLLPLATPQIASMASPLVYPLAKAMVGQWVRLGCILDPAIQLLAMRLGLSEGALLRVKAKLPAGPLVVVCGQTELALGRELCHAIPVHPLE
ncbi:MAG: ferrous iron transport protein A [Vampirovibrionales bacterium]|nr:ferrous iron transport protein A [Vampirovibrionales bacterium]